jgi:hypothetical protein
VQVPPLFPLLVGRLEFLLSPFQRLIELCVSPARLGIMSRLLVAGLSRPTSLVRVDERAGGGNPNRGTSRPSVLIVLKVFAQAEPTVTLIRTSAGQCTYMPPPAASFVPRITFLGSAYHSVSSSTVVVSLLLMKNYRNDSRCVLILELLTLCARGEARH